MPPALAHARTANRFRYNVVPRCPFARALAPSFATRLHCPPPSHSLCALRSLLSCSCYSFAAPPLPGLLPLSCTRSTMATLQIDDDAVKRKDEDVESESIVSQLQTGVFGFFCTLLVSCASTTIFPFLSVSLTNLTVCRFGVCPLAQTPCARSPRRPPCSSTSGF